MSAANDDTEVLIHRLRPGDSVVVRVPRVISKQQARVLADAVCDYLAMGGHIGIPVLVLDEGMSLETLRPSSTQGATA